MMIPRELKELVERQAGDVHRADRLPVEQALRDLGISSNSQFAEFFLNYVVTLYVSERSDEQLCDLIEPTAEIASGTRYVHEVWGLPEWLICLTSVQGEGAYLYDIRTGKVWDFDLGLREDFLAGRLDAKWDTFFAFMAWYLGDVST